MCIRDRDKTFVLNERNHWHQAVELPQAEYQVIQKEDPQFKELYYLIDDARECDGTIDVYKRQIIDKKYDHDIQNVIKIGLAHRGKQVEMYVHA